MTKKKPDTELNHAPIHIPAGSYDFQALRDSLEKAVTADPEKRGDVVRRALESAAEGGSIAQPDPSLRPDQRLVEVEHPELGIKEQVRVHDAGSEAAEEAARASDKNADRQTRQAAAIAARTTDAAPEPVVQADPEPAEQQQEG